MPESLITADLADDTALSESLITLILQITQRVTVFCGIGTILKIFDSDKTAESVRSTAERLHVKPGGRDSEESTPEWAAPMLLPDP